MLDVGPYYVANLIQLIGPVKRVARCRRDPHKERTIRRSRATARRSRSNTPTTIHALLEFANGAVVTLNASWDVWAHGQRRWSSTARRARCFVPDPNLFGGDGRAYQAARSRRRSCRSGTIRFGVPNQKHAHGMMANYRTAGLADMALAIARGRPHRCSMELALHAVDVMTGILKSGESGKFVAMQTTCERPEALGPKERKGSSGEEVAGFGLVESAVAGATRPPSWIAGDPPSDGEHWTVRGAPNAQGSYPPPIT